MRLHLRLLYLDLEDLSHSCKDHPYDMILADLHLFKYQ